MKELLLIMSRSLKSEFRGDVMQFFFYVTGRIYPNFKISKLAPIIDGVITTLIRFFVHFQTPQYCSENSMIPKIVSFEKYYVSKNSMARKIIWLKKYIVREEIFADSQNYNNRFNLQKLRIKIRIEREPRA